MMGAIQVRPMDNVVVGKDLNWCLQPILIPMRWIGLYFGSSPSSFGMKLYGIFLLVLNTTSQLVNIYLVSNGWYDRFHAQHMTQDAVWILKIDCIMYSIAGMVGNMIGLFDMIKKWNQFIGTYQQLEFSYNFNLYPMIRKLSVIASLYISLLVGSEHVVSIYRKIK